MTELNSGVFENRMAPEDLSALRPPVTWSGWWDLDTDQEIVVDGVGIVSKIEQDSGTDDDSYSYYERRVMVFRVSDCGGDRYFKVSKSSSSFGYGGEDPWEYPDVTEVRPREMTVTRWVSTG